MPAFRYGRQYIGEQKKKTASDDDADHGRDDEFLRLFDGEASARAAALALKLEVDQQGADNVGQAVPSNPEIPVDMDGNRIDIRIRKPV